jgi:hypothetical protein
MLCWRIMPSFPPFFRHDDTGRDRLGVEQLDQRGAA